MKKLLRIPLYIIAAATLGSACNPFDLKTEDLEIKVDLNVIKTTVTVFFEDVATGQVIGSEGDKEIRVRFGGADAKWIVDNSGNYLTGVNTMAGLVSFGLDPYNTAPSGDNPSNIVLDVEIDGYLSTTWPVSVTDEGTTRVRVLLASSVNPPKGVTVPENKDAGESENGVVKEEIKIETAPGEDPVTIAAGTVLTTAEGKPLEGKLDVTIAQFDPAEREAAKAFPGGLSGTMIDETGKEIKASFQSLGFMKIEIKDQNGNKADGVPVDQIMVSPKVDGSVINPNTGQPVKAGDPIPMWGLNESTGQWVFVKNVIASQPMLKMNNDFGYGMYNFGFTGEIFTLIAKGFLDNYSPVIRYPGALFNWELISERHVMHGSFLISGQREKFLFFKDLPQGTYSLNLTYTETGTCPYQFPATATINLSDANLNYRVNFTYNPPPTTTMVTFDATIYCTDMGNYASIPNGIPLRYRVKGTTQWGQVTANGGNVIIGGLEMDETYEVQALYNGAWTPSPAYEYTLSPMAGDVGNNLARSLNFDLECD